MPKENHKTLSVPFEVKQLGTEDRDFFRIEGYACVFGNVDKGSDVILPGAFQDSISSGEMPRFLKQHELYSNPLGTIDSVSEDSRGLLFTGRIPRNTDDGRNMIPLIKMGALKGVSIGFAPIDTEFREDGVRVIKEIDLMEISLVTFPMNEEATVTGFKADNIKSIRDAEMLLKERGFTNKESKSLISTIRNIDSETERDASEEGQLTTGHRGDVERDVQESKDANNEINEAKRDAEVELNKTFEEMNRISEEKRLNDLFQQFQTLKK